MITYHISLYQPSRHRLKVTFTIPCPSDETSLHIAAWRPGRYEEGNFSALVSHVQGFNENRERVLLQKKEKNEWIADTRETESLTVSYLYYGAILTAGNTYLDESMLLVNPVNLLIYNEYIFNNPIRITLDIPSDWQVCGLAHQENVLEFDGIDTLFDSPFFAAAASKTNTYEVDDKRFYIHLWGKHSLDEIKLLQDFRAFSQSQINAFGTFPVPCFSFILIGTHAHYLHGVEHLRNTVIVLGPTEAWHNDRYSDLLHVASHELYHVWNVKTIRPASFQPYRFQSLNYSRLGYVYEGITTYMGDYHLLKSGVITPEKYLTLLTNLVQTHIDNPGRYSMSVGDSSIDTWVDGYVMGTPGKKVSIYNEGALIAFYLDYRIRSATQNKCSLDTLMKELFNEFGSGTNGYEEQDILRILHNLCGIDFTSFFTTYVHQANGYETFLTEAFAFYGISFTPMDNPCHSQRELGIKTIESQGKIILLTMAPGSPAELGGLAEMDQILMINGKVLRNDLDMLLENREETEVHITVLRNGLPKEITLPIMQKSFYPRAALRLIETDTHQIHKNRKIFGL
ncbi:MAG: PDZ domain-containing protein [Flavobacteriales bacterium]